MRVIGVETVVPKLAINRQFAFCLLHTDAGLTGLGQTVDLRTVGVLHDLAERFVIGADPRRSKALWHTIFDDIAYHGYAGAEMRALSAIDIAAWDLTGQAYGRPIVDLLGGPVRDRVPIYNTCGTFGEFSDGRRLGADAIELCHELLAEGIGTIKWAPFSRYARTHGGHRIATSEIARAVAGIEAIAAEFGDRMQVMVELHGLWTPACAAQIAAALAGLPVPWIEDPVAQDNVAGWVWLRGRSAIPIAGGERLQTRFQLQRLIAQGGLDVAIGDVTWTGGITEAVRIAELADVHGVSFATHGNSGPVNLWASAHVLAGAVNAFAAETVRVYHHPANGFYHTLAQGPAILDGGFLQAPTAPGLGIELVAGFAESARQLTGIAAGPGSRSDAGP